MLGAWWHTRVGAWWRIAPVRHRRVTKAGVVLVQDAHQSSVAEHCSREEWSMPAVVMPSFGPSCQERAHVANAVKEDREVEQQHFHQAADWGIATRQADIFSFIG